MFYLALCYYLLHGELRATGALTFPLDDTYIAMALAKKFALARDLGSQPERFSVRHVKPPATLS